MSASDPANDMFKCAFNELSNVDILTNSTTSGDVQTTFAHLSVGNKTLEECITDFFLVGSFNSPSVFLIDDDITCDIAGYKIFLPIAELVLRATTSDLKWYKKQRDWVPLNAVLISTFLTEAALLDMETSAEDILKIFTQTIK